MNITSWALVAIGTIFVLWGFLKPEHQLSPKEAVELLESRKQYLPELKENVIKKTKQLEHIRDIASGMVFNEYLTKYISDPAKLNVKENGVFSVLKEITLMSFKIGIAMNDNLYYEELKQADDVLRPLETEYDLLVPQVKDKNLKKKLNTYWMIVDKTNSRIIFERMMRRSEKLTPIRRNMVNFVEKIYSRKLKPITIRQINDRIDDLLDGVSDE